jgi:hypothetical protein
LTVEKSFLQSIRTDGLSKMENPFYRAFQSPEYQK